MKNWGKNHPTDHDIFVEILKFKGVDKMKILIITYMSFLTTQMNSAYPKTYI